MSRIKLIKKLIPNGNTDQENELSLLVQRETGGILAIPTTKTSAYETFWKIPCNKFFSANLFLVSVRMANLPKSKRNPNRGKYLISHFNFNLFNFYPFLVNHLVPACEWDAIIFGAFLCIEPAYLRLQIGPYPPLFLTSLAPKWHEHFLIFVNTLCLISITMSYKWILNMVTTTSTQYFRTVNFGKIIDTNPWNEGHHLLSNHYKYNLHSMFHFSRLN